ncbi:glycosyltransferase [Chlamydiota bacterium]
MKRYRVLFISSHFPNREHPTLGLYNLQQIRSLKQLCDVIIIAPIFWFPFFKKRHRRKVSNSVLGIENINGLEVYHPKIFYIPKLLRSLYGFFYFLSLIKLSKHIKRNFSFDCIYTNWLYPDGFGVMLLSKIFKVPYIACGLGSDINMYLDFPLRRRMIKKTIDSAASMFVVSKALKRRLVQVGIKREVQVLYDGVDQSLFKPIKKELAWKELRVKANKNKITIIYIGNLEEWKGIFILLDAFILLLKDYRLKNIELFVIGGGPLYDTLYSKIIDECLEEYVFLQGEKPHKEISLWINASDLVCIPSFLEGLPNVLLESIACGKPVVATRVGGIPEVLSDEKLGFLVERGNTDELAEKLHKTISNPELWNTDYISSKMKQFTWEENSKRLYNAICSVIEHNN